MKKKLLSLVLVAAMVMGLSMTAMAAPERTDADKGLEEYSNTVDVKIVNADTTVYNVDIVWDSMDFTYTFGGWNPETHLYADNNAQGSWDKTNANVTVTNHSNAVVGVQTTLTASADTKGVTAGLSGESVDEVVTLDNAAITAYANVGGADNTTAMVTISGTPTEKTNAATFTVGTVKVVLSAEN